MDPSLLLALAAKLIETTKLKDALAEIDARPVPGLVRAFHTQELLEAVFPKLWEQLAVHEQLGEQGADALRPAMFAALCIAARARSHTQRLDLAWTRFGEEPQASSPATASSRGVGYVLLYDPHRNAAVFLSGSSPTLFGQTWQWRGEDWQSCAVIEHAIPEPHNQGFMGLLDPSRGGIACWTLVARQPGDFERYQPYGLLVRGEAVELIETGEPPVVPSQMLFAFGAIFGVDPASNETILLARDGLYALRAGQWVRLCALEPSVTSKEWRPGTRAAFAHRDQLYFTWTDTDNFSRRCRLLRFTGQGVQEVTAAHAPDGGWDAVLSDSTGACFLTGGVLWRLDGPADKLAWRRVDSAPTLPKISGCRGAVLLDGAVLVGPGDLQDSGGAPRYQRCFFHARGAELTQLGEVLEGVGSVASDRTLLGLGDQVLAVHASGRVDRARGEGVERMAQAQPGLALTSAGVGLDGQGRVMAVAKDAAMWRLEAQGWQRVGEPDAEVAAWTIVCCAWDPPRDRMVIWGFHGDPDSRLSERTAAWSNGSWTRLDAGSTLPAGERYLRAQMDNQMVFDTHLQELVFVGAHSVCVLSEDRWHPSKPSANLFRGASTGSALLVHDQDSATTLFIDTKDRWCGRLDGGQLTLAASLRSAPDRLATYAGTGKARRAAMVYVPASRSVIVFASGQSFSQLWELPLAEVFANSSIAGERKPIAKHEPSAPRFTGPAPRRLADVEDRPAASTDGVTFQRFGEAPPADWPLPAQTSDEPLLVFDGLRKRWVLLRSNSDGIECWAKADASWQLLHRSENRVPWSATVRLSSDPRRGAVLWCVSEEHGTTGYQITDQGLTPLETSGDGPVRSDKSEHRDKVVFAWDRREERLLGFSTEGLWALSDDHRWSRVASWNGATPLHAVDWFRKSDGGAWDAGSQRLVLWKFGYSEGLRCWAVTADGVITLAEANLAEQGTGVLAESDQGLLLYDGKDCSLRRLEGSGWVTVEPGHDAPALDSIGDPVMACHGDRIELVSRRPFQFHSRERGQWSSHGQPAADTRPRGAGYFGRHHGQPFAAASLEAWLLEGSGWQPAPRLMMSLLSTSWRSEVGLGATVLGVVAGEGPVRVLAECGAMGELTEQGWALQRPRGDRPMRDGYYNPMAARCPGDGSWLVMLRGASDALTFRGSSDGAWSRVGSLPFSERLPAHTSRQLTFDTRLGCFVLVGADGVLHLRDDAWVFTALSKVPEFDKLVHDPKTGVTLLVDLRHGKVHQLGESTCVELRGTVGPPPSTRQRAIRGVSAAECMFDVDGQRLLWFDSEDVWGNYELDLSRFFEQGTVRSQQ